MKTIRCGLLLGFLSFVWGVCTVAVEADEITSLLTGMTPSNFTLPSGWTLVTKEDFENGKLGPGEALNGTMTIGSDFAHTGSHAAVGTVNKGDCTLQWTLAPGYANTRTTYISWWDYCEIQTRFHEDFWLGGISLISNGNQVSNAVAKYDPGCPNLDTTIEHNPLYFWNGISARVNFYTEGTNGLPNQSFNTDQCYDPKFGKWTQWEILIRSNDPGASNGEMQVWQDGVPYLHVTNKNMNGNFDVSGNGHNVFVGGVYTAYMWYNKGTTQCMSEPNAPGIMADWKIMGSLADPCPCPGECPAATYNGYTNPAGYIPIFKRYFDDIIVMQKSNTPTMTKGNNPVRFSILYNKKMDHSSLSRQNGMRIFDIQGRQIHASERMNRKIYFIVNNQNNKMVTQKIILME